jgi:1-acyl-sn-glycerol-3-phosphate acyltransferase
MSDAFYKFIRYTWRFPFWASSRPLLLGMENIPREGPCLLASTHESPFEAPMIVRHTPRLVDIVSIVEEFRKPVIGWFYGSINCFPLDRSRADPKTVRILLNRLERGRTVLIFPEGGIRTGAASVVHGGPIRRGIGRIARLANVPVIPVVVFNSPIYLRISSWLPLRHIRYGLMYGKPIPPTAEPPEIEAQLVQAMVAMYAELEGLMKRWNGRRITP